MDSEKLIPSGVCRPVAVLAHPDDEALWCAGLIASSDLHWTVICCSIPDRDPPRAYRFFYSCEVLGAKPRMLPFRESEGLQLDRLKLDEFDFILTHGAAGEYGHRHHIEIHDYISERHADRSRYIGYGGPGRFRYPLDAIAKHAKEQSIKCYNDEWRGMPQWQFLLNNYGKRFDLWTECYD